MLMTLYTHTFLVDAAPAAMTPCVPSSIGGSRWNDVPALAGRYAR